MSPLDRFDEETQRKIAKLYAGGGGLRWLSAEYKTSPPVITAIVKRFGGSIRPTGRMPKVPRVPPSEIDDDAPRIPWAEILMRRAMRAPDTRDFQARLFGDPRFLESALGQKLKAEGRHG